MMCEVVCSDWENTAGVDGGCLAIEHHLVGREPGVYLTAFRVDGGQLMGSCKQGISLKRVNKKGKKECASQASK